jgi:alanine racemase
MEQYRQTFAEINIENLVENWSIIQKLASGDRFVCPMVKANAYGHSATDVAFALEREGAKGFGVSLIEEGLDLREAGLKSEILVFGGFDKQGAEKILEYQMIPVVSSWEQLNSIESLADSPVKIHLKFDTGMNRLGFAPSDSEKLSDFIKKSKVLKLKAVLTHLACSEDSLEINGFTAKQLQSLSDVNDYFKTFDVYTHALNTGGILGFGESPDHSILKKNNWGFRPGLMLYGYQSPGPFKNLNLKPVMSLKSIISHQRLVRKGETVSYGAKWTASEDTHIGVVPVGYADGFNRLLSNRGHVLIGGELASVTGTVCMDFFMVNLNQHMKSKKTSLVGEEVLLFGQGSKNSIISVDEIAKNLNTISWEVLTSVSSRVPRHFKGLN